jgi:hypothetical protein
LIKVHGIKIESNEGKDITAHNKMLWVGPVASKGKDLHCGKNFADYVDERGRGHVQLLKLFNIMRSLFLLFGFWYRRKQHTLVYLTLRLCLVALAYETWLSSSIVQSMYVDEKGWFMRIWDIE